MQIHNFLSNIVPTDTQEAYIVHSEKGIQLGPLTLGAIANGLQLTSKSVADVVTSVVEFMLQKGVDPSEFCLFNDLWRYYMRQERDPRSAMKTVLEKIAASRT
jgi:hypothetical protein